MTTKHMLFHAPAREKILRGASATDRRAGTSTSPMR